ncbi:metallophosphoesterase [Pyxidicoccus fallax]|uniref:Metallophosphoesterase n=1 Tax=Pyxidicoccus fallax TaxID=394095 RepID=A0A848LAT0_9BACT|nr:metallophosphoesterase [Pyxidicoccus fallax]NMO15614.1 metallophosphoesterase [Pyxidicoccus fallax]NPC77211.1 metallophosphoesterase [Pyxidicoccus fallax]
MSLRTRLQGRFQLMAAALVTVVQLPPVLWLCWLTRTPLPALAALGVSWPYLKQLQSPWTTTPRAPSTYVALGWWSACLVFDVLMLPALLAIRAGTPADATWGLAGAVALLLGGDAVLGRPRLRRRTVRIAGLPPELDGYRIGQLSDVHCGPHVPEEKVAGWVSRLNGLGLDLVTVTGDLITHGSSHVEAVARALGGLRAKDGAYVSMGNHDYFTDGEQLVRELERNGLHVLRNRGVVVRRGEARLYVAGVDDTWTSRHDLSRALAARPEGSPTVLLAHDPDLFPQAVERGVELTLSGHTHGGQLGVPGIRRLSLARVITEWTAGLYRRGRSWLYVNRGAGTTGPPVRLGAPPELAVITLRRE